MVRTLSLAAAVLAILMPQQPATEAPRTFQLDGQLLVRIKAQHDADIFKRATHDADAAMHSGPFSVTQKSPTPPSGDKHDYLSLAPYYWPNPATDNHLPYIRRDGQRNPQVNAIPDHTDIFAMEKAVHALALGYELTNREDYAKRATLLIRTWFLDPQTRMHPNIQYGQAVLGENSGRPEGVLEARGLPEVTDAVGMLHGSLSWTPEDQKGIEAWFTDYYQWLTTSKIALGEAAHSNNHGSWYDAQTAGIALFLGKTIEARTLINDVKTKRIARQIDPDGKQPLELARTKSFSYSIFNLEALMQLANEGDRVGIDLWHYRAPNGGSIQAAVDYLMPFALGKDKWSYETITGFDGDDLRLPLLRAAVHYHDPKYLAASERLGGSDSIEVLLLKAQLSQ
jgi:Alginate lyase